MGNFFYLTYQLILKNKIWGWVGFIGLIAALSAVASQIQFEEDITKLIPSNAKTQEIQKVLKSVNFTDKIIVNIKRSPQGSVEDLTQYASEFLDSLDTNFKGYIKNIQGKVNDDAIFNTMDFVYQNLPLFLEESDYAIIRQKIQKDSIAKITESNYRTLISPSGIIAKKTILKDPLGLSFIGLKKLQQLGVGDDFTLKDGFLLSKNEENLLLFITPVHNASETAENTKFAKNLYRLQEQLNSSYANKVQSEYFGSALVAVANAGQIKKDIQFTVSIALTLLIIILIFFYKKITVPIILFLPTLVGGLLSVALLYVIRTKISAISLGIGSVLLGVTLDYSLHILTHIRNNETIKSLYEDVSKPILMSSLTTASAFLCLLFLDSQALQDLGIFAATSVLGASIFALLFIPQAYKSRSEKFKKNTFLDRIAGYELHTNKWGILILVIFMVVSVFTYNKVTFNKDLTKLNYEPQYLIDARNRLDALTDINSKSIYLTTYGKEQEKVLYKNDTLFTKLKQLKNDSKILNYSSVGALVHSERLQHQKIASWKNFWNDKTFESVKNQLITNSENLGFKANTFRDFYELLQKDFKPLAIQDYNEIQTFTIDDYITVNPENTTITSLIKVAPDHIKEVKNAFSDGEQTVLIDRQQMNETFLGNLKSDFNRLIIYSLLVVVLILLLFYKSFSLTLVTGIPIFLTWFLTIGIMGLLQIEFNIFNSIISTFIFGLGVDYSIFITNGLLTEYRTGEKTLSTHKTSIILSVITTILGVGVLIFAKHPALYTISLVSLIGILSAVFVAFTIQPLLFRLFIGNRMKRPIHLRYLIHSVLSFGYFGLGGFLFSIYAWVVMKISPKSVRKENTGFHRMVSSLMKSVLYTNGFVSKKISNPHSENFEKPAMLIANHTSFLDILAIGMLHPKIIFLVNDWVYNSPVFGSAAKLAGAFPVSGGLENGEADLREKVAQGFSLIAFPEGTRSNSNKIKRFHKGAFYLAEQFNLDILPIMIHGNSEVLPKGSFIIRDGNITVSILKRISWNDASYGNNYTARTKKILAHFRGEFQKLRNNIESITYWHKPILEHYRYQGDVIHKTVKKDLIENKESYAYLLKTIDKKESIIHLSKDYGQLDFLLTLDSVDRKITTYFKNEEAKVLVKNNFIVHNFGKITVVNTIEEALGHNANTLIVTLDNYDLIDIEDKISAEINTIIVIETLTLTPLNHILQLGFEVVDQEHNFIVAKRIKT